MLNIIFMQRLYALSLAVGTIWLQCLLGQIDEMRKRFAESLSTDVVQSSRLVDPQFAQLILNEGRVTG